MAWLEEEDASSGPQEKTSPPVDPTTDICIVFEGQSAGGPDEKYNKYLDRLKQENEAGWSLLFRDWHK